MAAEVVFCKFHQFGHCKFGSTCRKFHTKETCNTFKCLINDCPYRHPNQCKFYVLYGRCKFGTACSFLHASTDDEVTKAIKTIQDEVSSLKSEVLSLKSMNHDLQSTLNSMLEELKSGNQDKIEIESDIVPASSCELCDLESTSEDILKQHISTVHDTSPDVQQSIFKCDLCSYESKSKKGVKIHRGSKHKAAQPSSSSKSSTSTSQQTPINCILQGDGCPNLLSSYFNKYTAICASCQVSMENKLQSSPFPPNLCPCCHQASNGLPYSLCSECLESIHEDGYADSSWGSWHLNRSTGQILCIGLDFD